MASSLLPGGRWGAALALGLNLAFNLGACNAGGGGFKTTTGFGGQIGAGGATPSTSTAAGASPTGSAGTGGGVFIVPDAGSDAHTTQCDDAGCTCIKIASIGHEGVWGPCSSDSTTALQDWLNTQSTAKVDNYDTTKPTLTPAFLAQYDVILLQWMVENGEKDNDGPAWVFSADEVSALKDWVNAGGGVIALSGYQCNGQGCTIYDTTATNQLLSFTDVQFNSDDVFDPSTVSCQDCYCWGGSLPNGGPIADGGAPNLGPWDQSSPIGAHINDVGSYVGRSIQSTTATVDSTDGTHKFAVHEQVGQGHIFAYGDEWVTYSGEWLGTASCLNPSMYTNQYDPCYRRSAAQVFQISQFWFNAIKYASSAVQCFTISNPGIIQ